MMEQKNLFLAIGLSIAIIVVFQFLFPQQTMMSPQTQQSKEEIHPAEHHYTDRIQEIDRKGKSWLAKRMKNQGQKEVQDRKKESVGTGSNKEGKNG